MGEVITWLIMAAAVGAGVMGVFGIAIQCISIGILALAILSIGS
jgi:hypothetical protein